MGTQGSVFAVRNLSHSERFAVKFHERERAYYQELAVYLRLRDLQEDNWPKVELILAEFRSYGIYIADVNPGNIRFV